ncbi:MAG: AEC family transporter [Cyanophyceae cyanobacterium]
MYVINTLAPVFLIILLGAVLQRTKFLSPQLTRESNRLVYWVGLPCLLFNQTAQAELASDSALRISLVLVAGMVSCIAVAYSLSRLLRLPGPSEGAFVQAAFRGNLAFIGLPVVSYALSHAPATSTIAALSEEQLQSLAVLSFAPLVPLYNAAAVLVLIAGNGRAQHSWVSLLRSVVTNPLLIACGLGLSWSLAGLALPLWLSLTCRTVGQMSLPLALLGVGVSLVTTEVRGQVSLAGLAALLKVALAPLVGVLVSRWLGLSPLEQTIALLYLACPTAIASYIMAQQLGGDDALASSTIVLSTLLSAVALATVLTIS